MHDCETKDSCIALFLIRAHLVLETREKLFSTINTYVGEGRLVVSVADLIFFRCKIHIFIKHLEFPYLEYLGPGLRPPPPRRLLPEDISTLILVPQQRLKSDFIILNH